MGDGDCLFQAVLKQLSFKQEVHEWVFAPVFLRRMLIVHYLKCRKDNDNELFWCVRKCLFAYGLPEGSEVGPFSIRSYFKHMVKDKTWGDIVCLYLIASMWSLSYSPKFKYFRRNEDKAQHVLFTSRPPHCVQ